MSDEQKKMHQITKYDDLELITTVMEKKWPTVKKQIDKMAQLKSKKRLMRTAAAWTVQVEEHKKVDRVDDMFRCMTFASYIGLKYCLLPNVVVKNKDKK